MNDRAAQPPPDVTAVIGRLLYPGRPGTVVRFTAEMLRVRQLERRAQARH